MLKLGIYKKQKCVKTYTASTYDLMFGTAEDILALIKAEDFRGDSKEELEQAVMDLAMKSMSTVKALLLDIFDGLTEEELRNTKLKEVARVLIEVVRYAAAQMGGGTGKN